MASIKPPATTYRPQIDKSLIEEGRLSDAQLENITLAGQSHGQTLPSGARQGFFIGDGTGVGKGREIAGIFMDNANQGRKKGLWISYNGSLFPDAQRDLAGVGSDKASLIDHSKIKAADAIPHKEGILFSTYSTLAKTGKAKEGQAGAPASRLDQIVKWLGPDFDGVIAFDEAHLMGNAVQIKGARGVKKPSQRALAGVELQAKLPKARVVYVSATGATEVSNLSYAERLGLWGPGTAFEGGKAPFIRSIEGAGVAAMEMVARDLKAMGLYMARSISYHGVTFEKLEHALSGDQTGVYDELAGAWQHVLNNMDAALKETKQATNGNAVSQAKSQFWGTHQRFFNQVMTAMQMPTVIDTLEKDLANGHAPVIQLTNTNEAQLQRILADKSAEAEETGSDLDLETLDFTPRQALMDYIERGFPTQQYEEYTDAEGNVRSRPVLDSEGNAVQNAEAVRMREDLLTRLADVRVPENPLDMLLNHFGPDKVAEVTGRTRRVVRRTGKDGVSRMVSEPWGKSKSEADADDFQGGKKQMLIFSAAGGTGKSYHADLSAKNQRLRQHYILQAGWRADSAIQGLGRTHRSNQAQPPNYRLVSTDLNAQKRFVSTIARRMESLGALTKGSRESSSQGIFNAADNLETQYSTDAIRDLYRDIAQNHVPGVSADDFASQMGLKLKDERGNFNRDLEPDVKTFLNRLLNLKVDAMNKVWDAFFERMNDRVEQARQRGELDTGMETIRALNAEVAQRTLLNTDQKTGATTEYQKVQMKQPTRVLTADQLIRKGEQHGFVRNKQSGMVWANLGQRNVTGRDGRVTQKLMLMNHRGNFGEAEGYEVGDYSHAKFSKLSAEDARPLIQKAIDNTPKTYDETAHMITGALLPVWNRMNNEGSSRVQRIVLDNGERVLGRRIADSNINQLLQEFHAAQESADVKPADIIDRLKTAGGRVRLANGTSITIRSVYGHPRIELQNLKVDGRTLEPLGLYSERIQYENRFFVPEDKAEAVLQRVMLNNPVVEGMSQGGALGAAPAMPAAPAAVAKARASVQDFVDGMRNRLSPLPAADYIPATFDAVDTRAGVRARQVENSVRLNLPSELDDRAAQHIVEAGGDRAKLEEHLAKVKNSANPELAARYAPEYQHALDHLDQLGPLTANYRQLEAEEHQNTVDAGIPLKKRENYVTHRYKDTPPEEEDAENLETTDDGGPDDHAAGTNAGTRYFTRQREFPTYADAIQAGHEPETTRLSESAHRRFYNGQRLINEKLFHKQLTQIKASDGKPILSGIKASKDRLHEDGTVVQEDRLPAGYDAVQAGDHVLTVHHEYAPLLRALYGESAIRRSAIGDFAMKVAAVAKHGSLVLDTYHLFRVAAKSILGFQNIDYRKGLAGLDYADKDLPWAQAVGKITPEAAEYARANRADTELGLRTGLNVGKMADNLMEQAKAEGLFNKIPVLGPAVSRFNHFLFNEYARGVIHQAFLTSLQRNRAKNPGERPAVLARQAAKEVNEFFGNLGNQGVFKSKTLQDAARLIFLAPNWAESQFRSEARGIGQAVRYPVDAVRGRGFRPGNVALAMGGMVLASVVGNQLLNLFTKGTPTWENEDGHRWDAWIPGGPNNRGFYFSPLSIAAEYTHAMGKYLEGGEGALDAAAHIVGNKLAPGARAVKDLLSGTDYAGHPFGSTGERLKAAAVDAAPSPLPLSGLLEKNAKSPLGYKLNHQTGSLEKQGLSMVGLKVDPAQSARSKMFQMADGFRPGGTAAVHPPSAYTDLRHMLDNEDMDGAREEIGRLVGAGHKLAAIGHAFGIQADGSLHPEVYTGSKASEAKMLHGFNADQRKTYYAAQKEHAQLAQRFRKAAGSLQAVASAG